MKYHCRACQKWFQVNRKQKRKPQAFLRLHLDGLPFRALARAYDVSVGSAYNYCLEALEALPPCADITRTYCQKFGGILLVDGKYLSIKGYARKLPVVYGIDYTTHDIPHYVLALAENYQTCHAFFASLNLMGYPLHAVVCDDNRNIYETCRAVYPRATIQLCQVHYLRNVKTTLDLDHQPQYRPFFQALHTLFTSKRSLPDFDQRAGHLVQAFHADPVCMSTLIELERKKSLLLGYHTHKGTPTTTNLIESFNSHLQGRLDTIKGFESFAHADAWLNAYFVRRRITTFTDCAGKFRRLNGKTSLSQTQKPGMDVPIFF